MDGVLKSNLAEIRQLMRMHYVVRAYAFGSAATGKMHENSDVDFVVSFSPNLDYETYGNNYFKLLYALQNLLHKEVDLVAEETITNPYLLQNINSQKIAVL